MLCSGRKISNTLKPTEMRQCLPWWRLGKLFSTGALVQNRPEYVKYRTKGTLADLRLAARRDRSICLAERNREESLGASGSAASPVPLSEQNVAEGCTFRRLRRRAEQTQDWLLERSG
jgi:hypothetical protein